MVANGRKAFSFDRNMAFAEDLTITASGVVQFAATNVQLDLGEGYFDGCLVIDVEAIDTASNDESYTFIVEGCNTSGFGSGAIDALAIRRLEDPASTGTPGRMNVEHTSGRYIVPFVNLVDDAQYRYIQLNAVLAGTTPSIKFTAFVAPRSET